MVRASLTTPIFPLPDPRFEPSEMVKLKDILSPSFRDFGVKLPSDEWHPEEATLWYRCQSTESQFCKAVVGCGYLTFDQMVYAASRYRLGISKKGGVIFWQIDREELPHDGKVVYYDPDCHRSKQKEQHPIWVSFILAIRAGLKKGEYASSHCLFGLHLLTMGTGSQCAAMPKALHSGACPQREQPPAVAIVEAEKTAIILSVHYPQYIWLASGGLTELQADKFRPLRGHKVVLFPDTDPDGRAYRQWFNIAQEVMLSPFWEDSPPIYVSPLLELNATPDQKARKIDLIDFLFESGTSL